MNRPIGVTILAILSGILAVLAGTLLVLRWVSSLRMGGSRRDRRNGNSVTVVERHSLGRTGSIVVMRYAGREHVLGVTEASITHLADGTIDLRDRKKCSACSGLRSHSFLMGGHSSGFIVERKRAPVGQTATQWPQLMQSSSASSVGTGTVA